MPFLDVLVFDVIHLSLILMMQHELTTTNTPIFCIWSYKNKKMFSFEVSLTKTGQRSSLNNRVASFCSIFDKDEPFLKTIRYAQSHNNHLYKSKKKYLKWEPMKWSDNMFPTTIRRYNTQMERQLVFHSSLQCWYKGRDG